MAAGKSGGGAGQAAFLEGAFAVGELRGGWGWGETRDTGVPRAVVLSCVLQEGLAPSGGAGWSMAGAPSSGPPAQGSARPARDGAVAALEAEASGGLARATPKARTSLPSPHFHACLGGERRLLSGLAQRPCKVSDC